MVITLLTTKIREKVGVSSINNDSIFVEQGIQAQGMSTVPPQAVPSSTGASNPLSSGYYGSFYSLSFDVKFKRKSKKFIIHF